MGNTANNFSRNYHDNKPQLPLYPTDYEEKVQVLWSESDGWGCDEGKGFWAGV